MGGSVLQYWDPPHLNDPAHTPASMSLLRDDAQLASAPLTSVSDPRRSSVVSAAAVAAATGGVREVSPREVVERVMNLRWGTDEEAGPGVRSRGECVSMRGGGEGGMHLMPL